MAHICCGANDRLEGGLGVFLEFSFLRVNINTPLCNPNFNIVKIPFFPVPVDVGNLSNHVKSSCSSFLFFLIFRN